jgi:hypothetical protein
MTLKQTLWAVILLTTPVTALTEPQIEAVGTGRTLAQATENSYISAHFQCGRKGYWANLDTITVVKTDRSSYKMLGGRKRINQYHRTIRTTCTSDYRRYPTGSESEK